MYIHSSNKYTLLPVCLLDIFLTHVSMTTHSCFCGKAVKTLFIFCLFRVIETDLSISSVSDTVSPSDTVCLSPNFSLTSHSYYLLSTSYHSLYLDTTYLLSLSHLLHVPVYRIVTCPPDVHAWHLITLTVIGWRSPRVARMLSHILVWLVIFTFRSVLMEYCKMLVIWYLVIYDSDKII